MLKVEFDEDRCKGCELCTDACPKNIVIMADHYNAMGFHPATVVEQEKCISCAFCARMCPDVVITVRKEGKNNGQGTYERK
jgi:2-oxoglutarate ferredoxin oxidoreductase subunit delta